MEKISLTEQVRKKLGIMQEKEKENEEAPKNTTSGILQARKANLDDKVDDFVMLYYRKRIKGKVNREQEYQEPIRLKNFIEKMAIWYELRYPSYELNLSSEKESTPKNVSSLMFDQNPYVNEQLGEEDYFRVLDWNKFYNSYVFFASLSEEERKYFKTPTYPKEVYWNLGTEFAHLELTSDGYIEESQYIVAVMPEELAPHLNGLHITELVKELRKRRIQLPEKCEFVEAIQQYELDCYFQEELLNSVMYRIMERGGSKIGPRRAFLFAKEFNRNFDIPMAYAIDDSDPDVGSIIKEYLSLGGKEDLICYANYFKKASKYERIQEVNLKEVIVKLSEEAVTQDLTSSKNDEVKKLKI